MPGDFLFAPFRPAPAQLVLRCAMQLYQSLFDGKPRLIRRRLQLPGKASGRLEQSEIAKVLYGRHCLGPHSFRRAFGLR